MQKALELFLQNWDRRGETAIVEYMRTTYGPPWDNWGLWSFPAGLPIHNQGLEALNGGFKKNGTSRERSDLGTFSNCVMDYIYSKSVNETPFPASPNIPPSTWRMAQLLLEPKNKHDTPSMDFRLKTKPIFLLAQSPAPLGSDDWWLLPSLSLIKSLSSPTTASKAKEITIYAMKWMKAWSDPGCASDFALLLNVWHTFYLVRPMPCGPVGDVHYQCSCKFFARYMECSHSVGMGIKDSLVTVPEDRLLTSLGRTKRSQGGRYAKAKRAFDLQPDDNDAGTAFASSQAMDPCCYICGGRHSNTRNQIVFCDTCDNGYHQKCLNPVLRAIPIGSWFCSDECKALH